MARKAEVYLYDRLTGILIEDETGYDFRYLDSYLQSENAVPISRLLPLQSESFHDRTLFPFFDGLIPEGWLLEIAEQNWKLNPNDRMGLLLACCRDCIGAASIREVI
ncbi:HipA N-terminal domain-containing protein [uncultured Victivallis sp.]|uniref:HipA N-terminal domain-containing protein n=1 Tax=uncultured Victivallis sp. TaxID=354118 RepID=UPI002583E4A4|nr:HipA N-terminal domain-containing protein [uncultured Victivallis sp.]